MALKPTRILVIEDEAAHAEAIARSLETMPAVELRLLGSLWEFREQAASWHPDIALMDLNLPDGQATEVLPDPTETRAFPIIVMTSYGSEQAAVAAMKCGAMDYLVKSADSFHALPKILERVLREWELRSEGKRMHRELQAREASLQTLAAIDRIVRQAGVTDLQAMNEQILAALLTIFDCDRAWLLHPADPEADAYTVPMEQTRAEFPGGGALGQPIPMSPAVREIITTVLVAEQPVAYGSGQDQPVPEDIAEGFAVQAQLIIPIVPTQGKPWLLGLHQCSHARGWNEAEKNLFTQIGTRVAAGLNALLFLRQLQESEARAAASHRLVRLMADNVPDLIWAKDAEGRYLFVNQAMSDTLLQARDTDEPVGKTDLFFAERERATHPERADWHTFGELCLGTEAPVPASLKGQRFDESGNVRGEFLFLDVYKAPFLDEQNRLLGTVGSARVVTREKLIEAELQRQTDALRLSAARQSAMIANIADVIAIIDPDGTNRYKSPNVEKWFGWKPEELIGKDTWKNIHPEDLGRTQGIFAKVLAEPDAVASGQCRYQCRDGSYKWMEFEAVNRVHDPDIAGVLLNYHDITERRQAEEALAQSEARYRAQFDMASEGIFTLSPDGVILEVNAAFARMHGYTQAQMKGMKLQDLDTGASSQLMPERMRRLLAGEALTVEVEHLHQDGHVFPMEVSANLVVSGGAPTLLCFHREITERKQAEEALRESKERLEFALQGGELGTWDYYPKTGTVLYSDLWAKMLEYQPDEVESTMAFFTEHIHPDDIQNVFGRVSKHVDGFAPSYQSEHRLRTKSGRWLWVADRGKIVERDPEGHPLRITGIITDITQRKRAEEALKESQGLLEAAVANSPSGILIADAPDVRIRYANSAAFSIRGGDPYLLTDLEVSQHATKWQTFRLDGSPFPPEDLPLSRAVLKGLTTHDQEVIIRDELGVDHWVVANAAPILDSEGEISAGIVVFHDITDRKIAEKEGQKLQAQLQQSQKMESLGTLAGGVAHDMNNVLGAILGLASAHIGSQPYGSPLHQALDTICKATERGGKMVKSLLNFARQSPVENNKLDMNAILREQVALLERTTLAKVRLEIDLEEDLRPIQGDASALTHAFMNLCVNAVDAMPENGTLTLHTRNVDNDWIEVVVEDNGTGMSKEVLEKAMEPFYTTKETGKGTGLGLSMVFSTVKAHRGQMAIESEPGKGTHVMMRFPACEQEVPSQAVAFPALEATQIPHGTMKVLLIDDDDLIQSSVQAILEVLGYPAVNTAQSGEEALTMLEAGLEVDLVILDMNMPGLGGIGTLPRLRVLRPDVPVLLATGRIDQTAMTVASAHPGVTLLSKPFGLRELQKHLESIGLG